jgi:serine/threonine protein kinase
LGRFAPLTEGVGFAIRAGVWWYARVLESGDTLGSYRILDLLGEGAMGRVFRAEDAAGETVALKVIAGALGEDADARGRFKSECEILEGLRQPRIVGAHTGLEEAEGRLFYAMELIEGADLAERIVAEGPLPLGRSLSLAADVLEALAYAHARDVLHRDVKASNVLVDPEGRAKLSDFGLARALDATRATRPGSVLGTPAYMAPELAEGADATPASEIYAVGILLYEMLVGRPPFTGEQALSVLHQHVNTEPPALADVPAAVGAIVSRALAKRPEARFASATEMRDATLAARVALGAPAEAPVEPAHAPTDARQVLAAAETRELPSGLPLAETVREEGPEGPTDEATQPVGGRLGAVVVLALAALVLGIAAASRLPGPGTSPTQPPPSASPAASPTPPSSPTRSPSPVASSPASAAAPRVEVTLRDGERFEAELIRVDLARRVLITQTAKGKREDPLDRVESYRKLP